MLSTYTPMFCFLLLGYIFYARHTFGRLFFPKYYSPERLFPDNRTDEEKEHALFVIQNVKFKQRLMGLSPLICIILALICVFLYQLTLTHTINSILVEEVTATPLEFAHAFGAKTIKSELIDTKFILEKYQISKNINGVYLMMCYLGIFLFAELAFIIMAIKEFLQDLLGLEERVLIEGHKPDVIGA